jgi:thiamine kinase-like enzyme
MNAADIDIRALINHKGLLPIGDDQISSVEILKAGMTNQNFLCTTVRGSRYVVRIPGINTSEIINRVHEWNNHHKVAHLGLNVDHINYLKHSWMKTSVFITNKFEDINDRYRQIDLVCRGLKKLHHSKIVFENKFWAGAMIELYEAVAIQKGIMLDETYFALRAELIAKFDNYLHSNINWTPCHNDLVKENILWDGENDIYLIDWEYAGMNDPLWDISSYILENELNEEEEEYMLKSYSSGKTLAKDRNKMMTLFKIYQDVLWYVWAKIRTFHGCNYSQYAIDRLNRALECYVKPV